MNLCNFFCYIFFFIIVSLNFFCQSKSKETNPNLKFSGTETSFEFPEQTEWVNVNNPLSMNDLKGKVILLFFWKFSNINSIHSILELKKLEKKWENELIIIGVHSPKFSNEKDTASIRQAVLKQEINFPVLNDKNFQLWFQYGISSWPSLVLIDPNGLVIGNQIGEIKGDILEPLISEIVNEFRSAKILNPKQLQGSQKSKQSNTTSQLLFPGKLLLNEPGTELFLSDTNHNRILRIDTKAKKIINSIGSGMPGFKDGNFLDSKFSQPQGIALSGEILYIADSKNHTIREANLKTQKIRTIAGTGEQAKTFYVPGKGRQVALNSPWDLVEYKKILYITMRGTHQIWTLDLHSYEAEVYAGFGSENLFDGNLQESSFAQPTGITRDRVKFYITDSETSGIRAIDYKYSNTVTTIVGKGLYEFGDIDNVYPWSKLQFPMGITYSDEKLYVADTFNHKIKLIDPYQKTSLTLAGTGKIGKINGEALQASFFEPTSVAVFKNLVYVSDSNNHCIRILDTKTNLVSNFEFE